MEAQSERERESVRRCIFRDCMQRHSHVPAFHTSDHLIVHWANTHIHTCTNMHKDTHMHMHTDRCSPAHTCTITCRVAKSRDYLNIS